MKILFSMVMILPCFFGEIYSQDKNSKKNEFDKDKFLIEVTENACKCIDSIETNELSKKEIAQEISGCINEQVGVYQLGVKIAEITEQKLKDSTNINLEIDFNPDSKNFKEYYYTIERSLAENCPEVKTKMATNDKTSEKSVSSNSLALDYYNKGLKATEKGDFNEAISYYKKAVTVDPEFAFAYDNMGICYRKINDYENAIKSYEKSLKIDPNGTMPLQNIAVTYTYMKKYKKAVNAYEKLGKIQQENPEVFYGIGLIYTNYLNDLEKGLDNMCIAYKLYYQQKSPYRTDAENIIQSIHNEYKKNGKMKEFEAILKKHNLSPKD